MDPIIDIPALKDVTTSAAVAALAYKVLGPTASYVGGALGTYAEKAHKNFERILQRAAEKLGDKVNQPGEVPPRVLKGVVSEGAFCEDAVCVEYFAGVLASSRSELVVHDDRGTAINALIARMSAFQLRTHYLIYWAARDIYACPENTRDTHYRLVHTPDVFRVSIRFDAYSAAMFGNAELGRDDLESILQHTFAGLANEKLIAENYEFHSHFNVDVLPTVPGVELFLWSYGLGKKPIQTFFNPELTLELMSGISFPREFVRKHETGPCYWNPNAFKF